MKFATKRANEFTQSPLVSGVDVFVILFDLKLALVGSDQTVGSDRPHRTALPFIPDCGQTLSNLSLFLFCQDSDKLESLRVCDGTANICRMHALIILQRLIKFMHTAELS